MTALALLVVASPGGAETSAPTPVVTIDDSSPDSPVEGADLELDEPAIPGLPAANANQQGSEESHYECTGCKTRNWMYWTNYGAYEYVGVKSNRNLADRIIPRQTHHVVLLSGGACYDGTAKYQKSEALTYYEDSHNFSSSKYYGWNRTWTQASGHHWYIGSQHWYVNEANDRCRVF